MNEIDYINNAKNGDKQSVEYLLEKYKKQVSNICRKYFILGGDSDDLIQEAMIGLYKAIMTFDCSKNDNFYSYAKVIIERQIFNCIKTAGRKKHQPLNEGALSINNQGVIVEDELDFDGGYTIQEQSSPEDLIINDETYNNLKKMLVENLSSLEKQVFELYIDGVNYIDISKKLNKSSKCIDNTLRRIKLKSSEIFKKNN